MLTTEAFNAFLKVLEEPPPHVKFVLCTTDPQKMPETVRSRCSRLDFRRLATADVVTGNASITGLGATAGTIDAAKVDEALVARGSSGIESPSSLIRAS